MAIEDIKKNLNGENDTSINNTNNEALKKAEEDKQKALEERDTAVFENSFNQIASTYPKATEHKDAIQAKVKAGYSVDDATIAVLQKEGKLMTADEIKKKETAGEDLGGSNHTPDLGNRNTGDKEPTVEEAAQAFRDAEARGEIGLG